MKVFYSKFEDLNYIIIFGEVHESEWKVLQHGFHYLSRDLEKPMLIHLGNVIADPEIIPSMIQFKSKIQNNSKQTVSIIAKESKILDFKNLEGFYQKNQSKNIRLIIDRLKIEEEIYLMDYEIQTLTDQLKQLGFDPAAAKLEIQKNIMMKSQKTTLDTCLAWQRKRNINLKKIPSDIIDLEASITSCIAELNKALGKEVDL